MPFNSNGGLTIALNGSAVALNSQASNQFIVDVPFNFQSQTLLNIGGNYHVWATDYMTYSLVYGCNLEQPTFNLFGLFSGCIKEQVWILSRTKTLNPDLVNQMKAALSFRGVRTDQLRFTSQSCLNN